MSQQATARTMKTPARHFNCEACGKPALRVGTTDPTGLIWLTCEDCHRELDTDNRRSNQ